MQRDLLRSCYVICLLLKFVIDVILCNEIVLHGEQESFVRHEFVVGVACYCNCLIFFRVVTVRKMSNRIFTETMNPKLAYFVLVHYSVTLLWQFHLVFICFDLLLCNYHCTGLWFTHFATLKKSIINKYK